MGCRLRRRRDRGEVAREDEALVADARVAGACADAGLRSAALRPAAACATAPAADPAVAPAIDLATVPAADPVATVVCTVCISATSRVCVARTRVVCGRKTEVSTPECPSRLPVRARSRRWANTRCSNSVRATGRGTPAGRRAFAPDAAAKVEAPVATAVVPAPATEAMAFAPAGAPAPLRTSDISGPRT